MRNIYIIILLAAFCTSLFAGDGNENGGEVSIFRMGFSARSMGMGRAYTGYAADNGAIIFNPAGLDLIEQSNISIFHMNLIVEGASYDFLSYVYPTLHLGSFGFAIGRLGVNDYELTGGTPNINGYGNFGNYRAYISYGLELYEGYFIGTTFKADYISYDFNTGSGLNTPTAYGYGADLAFLYRNEDTPVIGEIQAGINLINIWSPQARVVSGPDSLPLMIRAGVHKPFNFNETNSINLNADISMVPKTGKTEFHLGMEYQFRDILAVRAGLDEYQQFTFGAGIKYKGFGLDYAFGSFDQDNISEVPLSTSRFSLSYSFGETRSEGLEMENLSMIERDSVLVDKAVSADRAQQIRDNIDSGIEYMGKEEWFNATVEFQQVISIDPFNREARAYFKQADSLLQKQYLRAQQEFAKLQADSAVARQDQEYIDHHYNRGREFLKKNQFTESLFEFNAALERDPGNKIILDARDSAQRRLDEEVNRLVTEGRRQYRLGNYPEALRNLSEARVLVSEDNSLLQEIEQMSRSIQSQGDLNKGLQALEAGDFKLAAEIFKQALETDPSNKGVEKYLKRAEGKANARKVVLLPSDEKEYLKGVDHFLSGSYKEALSIWEKLLDKYPYSKKLIDAVETAEQRLKRTQSTVLEQ